MHGRTDGRTDGAGGSRGERGGHGSEAREEGGGRGARPIPCQGVKELGAFILENRFRERHDNPPQILKGLSHKREIKRTRCAPGDRAELGDQRSLRRQSQRERKESSITTGTFQRKRGLWAERGDHSRVEVTSSLKTGDAGAEGGG